MHKLESFGGTSRVLRECSIGHLAKSTSWADTILCREVDLQKALRMLLRMLEYCLRGMPKSPVHNVVVDFAHGGNIVRSNCGDGSDPIGDMA